LIVDDESLMANALARVLRSQGHLVDAYTDPAQALQALDVFLPDIVMADLHMPAMRGTAFLAEVKRRRPEVRRVIVSGRLGDLSALERAQVEPCTLLAKPWTSAGLSALFGAEDR